MRPDLPRPLREALAAEPDGDALAEVWHRLGEAAPPEGAPGTDDAWAALRARVRTPEPGRRAPDRPARRPARAVGRRRAWAAGTAALAAVVALAWWAVPVTHHAAAGETVVVRLPDGSEAVLNSGSRLRHGRWLGGGRRVALVGEAFFDVERDEAPFVVETYNARVRVLGTAFNVRAWAGEGETSVAVVEGRVRVEGEAAVSGAGGAGGAVEVVPGERAVVGLGVPAAEPVDAKRAASWRKGGVAFEDRPLGAVLDEVERRYGVSIEAAPRAPLGVRVSAHYAERPALGALLGDLGAAAGARFTAEGDGYRVRAAERPRPARAAPAVGP